MIENNRINKISYAIAQAEIRPRDNNGGFSGTIAINDCLLRGQIEQGEFAGFAIVHYWFY